MSSIALISREVAYHRRVESDIGSHADQFDPIFCRTICWNLPIHPLGGSLPNAKQAKRRCRAA